MSSRIGELVKSLVIVIETFDNKTPARAQASHAQVENLLDLIFDIGRKKPDFTEQQKRKIASLVLDAIRPIQINVERTGCQYRTSLESSVLRKRSAIQFLIDDFGDFPVGPSLPVEVPISVDWTLSEQLYHNNIRETISILDKIIQNWRDVSDSDDEESKQSIAGIPESHTWWQ